MTDLPLKPATELAATLRSKQISARELLDLYLDRIERYNPALNAVVTLDEERSRLEAQRADDDAVRDNWRGPLHGRGHIPGMPGDLAPTDIGVLGPLARSAEDLALALDVLVSPDESNAIAWSINLPPPRHASLRDYRVAAWLDDEAAPIDAPVS